MSVLIFARRSRVWRALTRAEDLGHWYLPVLAARARPGGRWDFGESEEAWTIRGRVSEVRPGRRLVHTFRFGHRAGEPSSRVTFLLEDAPRGGPNARQWTLLTLVHDRLSRAPRTAADVRGGWVGMLAALKTLAESGRLPWRRSRPRG